MKLIIIDKGDEKVGTFTSTHTFSSAGAMNLYINLMGIQPQASVSITADGRIDTLVYILHTFKPQKKRRK